MNWKRRVRESLLGKVLAVFLCYMIVMIPAGATLTMAAPAADPVVQLEKGIGAYDNGNYVESESLLNDAKAGLPDNFAVPLYLGLTQLKLDKKGEAVGNFKKYLEMNPEGKEADTVRRNLTLLQKDLAKEEAQVIVQGKTVAGSGDPGNTVAVSNFFNSGSSEYAALSAGLSAMIVYDLAQIDTINVVERMKVEALLSERKLQQSNLVNVGRTSELGRMLQAGTVIPGSYIATKDVLGVSTEVHNTMKKNVVGTQNVKGDMTKFYKLEKDLVNQILDDIGQSTERLPATVLTKVNKVHTKSLPAFAAFSAGVVASDREDYPEAKKQFEKALDEDDDFELAAIYLASLPLALAGTAAIIAAIDSSAPGMSASAAAVAGGGGMSMTTVGLIGAAVVAGGVGVAAAIGSGDDSGSSGAVSCNTASSSGGNTQETRVYELGKKSGTFSFNYNMQFIKDRMRVTYQGSTLLDTGCVSGSATRSISYSGSSSQVTVQVIPACAGGSTAWSYTVGCP